MAIKTYRVDGRLDSEMVPLVRGAEPVVERVVGRAADRVEVSWEPGGDEEEGEPTARLRLTDAGVTRTGEFTAADLDDPSALRWRVYELWDAVLAERLDHLREAVHRSLAEEGA